MPLHPLACQPCCCWRAPQSIKWSPSWGAAWPGLLGTEYGHAVLLKVGYFIPLLTLASVNRLVLTEQMAQRQSKSLIQASIAVEMFLGVLVIFTAGFPCLTDAWNT